MTLSCDGAYPNATRQNIIRHVYLKLIFEAKE